MTEEKKSPFAGDSAGKRKKGNEKGKIRWLLCLYDMAVYFMAAFLLLVLYSEGEKYLPVKGIISQMVLGVGCLFICRMFADVYRQIWRYGTMSSYIRMMVADGAGFLVYYGLNRLMYLWLPTRFTPVTFVRALALVALTLLGCIAMRMAYHYIYRFCGRKSDFGGFIRTLMRLFTGVKIKPNEIDEEAQEKRRIRIAIVGAGRVGVMLADELQSNPQATYKPVCFIDTNQKKVGRMMAGLPVLAEGSSAKEWIRDNGVQEIVFALPQMGAEDKKDLYKFYKETGCKIKVYDYPTMQAAGTGKRTLREFDIEELLFRPTVAFEDGKTGVYYKDKVILITGGGGSIGSELCRQIAKMSPKQLIILDVYENGAYDVQQELRIAYKGKLNLQVEILSICDRKALDKVFAYYRPQIVLNAAAHKHVPLMEHNCCEAVKNNVFGTVNIVEMAEKYEVERMIMVSTDKAVNPTNVMGATKRMCEMIVQSHSVGSAKTIFSATRFGNVLGSAGSVIPLFKRQIRNGGPVTLTDKRIIRYFMTIPEASQLVLRSGAMAKNGELFVLDMGKPVKILELAENMIRLSGFEPYTDIPIMETGLRPGEKLYEELLVKTESLDKTDSDKIFVERDDPLSREELEGKLELLRKAVESEDDDVVREALHQVVPTFKTPEEVNAEALKAEEMQMAEERQPATV